MQRIPQVARTALLTTVLFVVASFAGTPRAWSQATTSMRGTVRDPQSGVVPNVVVSLFSSETQFKRTMRTNSAGQYDFTEVAPGTCVVSVKANGFATYERAGVQVLVNMPTTVDVVLTLGPQTKTVEVKGQAEALNLTDASLGTPFNENQITQLPIDARNAPDLLSVQSGVVYTSNRTDINLDRDTRSGAVDGARSDQSNITLDGIDVNNEGKGYAFTSVLPRLIQLALKFWF